MIDPEEQQAIIGRLHEEVKVPGSLLWDSANDPSESVREEASKKIHEAIGIWAFNEGIKFERTRLRLLMMDNIALEKSVPSISLGTQLQRDAVIEELQAITDTWLKSDD